MATNSTANLSLQNFFSTTLSAPVTASDTTIYLTTLPTGSEGFLLLDAGNSTTQELIFYNSKGANFVTVPTVGDRGRGGTTAQAHSSGAAVKQTVNAEYWTELQAGRGFSAAGIGAAPYADGWTPLVGVTPNTVTANGNRNYDLVFNSVDLTSQLSPGMKLRLTRTVAAPDQCADLETSSSQYFNKTSPSGAIGTMTDDYTCMAWVKLESYANNSIVSKISATNGFVFSVNTSGQIDIRSRNASADEAGTSYASVPLNKWTHVAATMDASGSVDTIYIDGVLVSSLHTGAQTAFVQGGNLEVGSANASNFFDGKLAQVAVFNAVLSAATIRSYMSQGLSGSETNCVGAWSLDNSLNDLTANANNLTANGGAAATATDSPFANAVAAGLLEYAEVNSVAFSTNTTVNVRVPETCQIPTSGGVNAVSYSTQSDPYGLPYFSKVIGYAECRVDFADTTVTTPVTVSGLTISIVVPTNAKVKLTTFAQRLVTSGATNIGADLRESTTVLASTDTSAGSNVNQAGYVTATILPTSGSHTYNTAIHQSGAGTMRYGATSTQPMFIQAELV